LRFALVGNQKRSLIASERETQSSILHQLPPLPKPPPFFPPFFRGAAEGSVGSRGDG
jgi:hypothetical protein